MTGLLTGAARGPDRAQKARGRFGVRAVLLLVALFLVAVPFTILTLLVRSSWGPLRELDQGAANRLHVWALGSPTSIDVMKLFTDIGGPGPMRALAGAAAVVLLLRRSYRLAAFVLTTLALAALLSFSLKAVVGRTRPVFDDAIVHAPGGSFPSGHAMTSLVAIALVLLVGLPHVRRRLWPVPICLGVVLVLAVGFTRIALGAHFISDVLGGWVIGTACVVAVTAAFQAWRREAPDRQQDDVLAVDETVRTDG